MPQILKAFVSRCWWIRVLRRSARPYAELESFPALRADEQRRRLARLLLGQIRYFAGRADALPEWVEAAKAKSPEDLWAIWPSLPIVNKEMLQTRFEPRAMKQRFALQGKLDATGGSTGEPTRFLHDPEMLRALSGANFYTRLRMGWRPGMATIIVWGSERDIGKSTPWRTRLYLDLCRDCMVDSYRLTPEIAERVVTLVRQNRPAALYGFTSMLEYVARAVLDSKTPIQPASVATAWNGGEMLFPEQAAVFKSAFGVPILNRYGGRELGAMACQFEADGPLQVLRPWLFAEIVRDDGSPAGPGETGRLLWTSTICRGTPFLRYDVGDLATYSKDGADESGIHALEELQGRVASLLRLPTGRVINNIFWNHLFKEMPEVEEFQIVNRGANGLKILLRGKGFSPAREAECRAVLDLLLGEMPKEISWVQAIPRTSQGKLVQVVREPASETPASAR